MGRSPTDLAIFVGKRLLQLIPVVLGIIVLTFVFTHISVTNCAVWYPHASASTLANCQSQFSKPIANQFWTYFVNLLHGDWGTSVAGVAVYPAIATGVPATLELVFASLFLMIVVGIPLGVMAAQSSGRWGDHLVRIFYLTGWATPTYLGAVIAA